MDKIKVGLFGFGKTGKIVANKIIDESECLLEWVIRRHKEEDKYASQLLGYEFKQGKIWGKDDITGGFFRENPVDVIIDFSSSKAVYEYYEAAQLGIPIVSAISKYDQADLDVLKSYSVKTAVLHSPNITVGINILMVAAQILQNIAPHADIEIVEEHFKEKKEVSGTAKKLAEVLSLQPHNIHSIRVGKTIGKHKIIFGLPNQTLRLIHESVDRAAFGQGAIFAAKFLIKQSPGLYSMEKIVTEMFKKNIPVY
jgi:4-hydroxy-tetrahydrodipicolinate reductase